MKKPGKKTAVLLLTTAVLSLSSCGGNGESGEGGLDGTIPTNFTDSAAKDTNTIGQEKGTDALKLIAQSLLKKLQDASNFVWQPDIILKDLPDLALDDAVDFPKEFSDVIQNSRGYLYELIRIQEFLNSDTATVGEHNCDNADEGGKYTVEETTTGSRKAVFTNCEMDGTTLNGTLELTYLDTENDNNPNKIELKLYQGFSIDNIDSYEDDYYSWKTNCNYDPNDPMSCQYLSRKDKHEEEIKIDILEDSVVTLEGKNGGNVYNKYADNDNLSDIDANSVIDANLKVYNHEKVIKETYDEDGNLTGTETAKDEKTSDTGVIDFDGSFKFTDQQTLTLNGNLNKLTVEHDDNADNTIEWDVDVDNTKLSLNSEANIFNLNLEGGNLSATYKTFFGNISLSRNGSKLNISSNGKDQLTVTGSIDKINIQNPEIAAIMAMEDGNEETGSELILENISTNIEIKDNKLTGDAEIKKSQYTVNKKQIALLEDITANVKYNENNEKKINADVTLKKIDVNYNSDLLGLVVKIGNKITATYSPEGENKASLHIVLDEGNDSSFVEYTEDSVKNRVELENGFDILLVNEYKHDVIDGINNNQPVDFREVNFTISGGYLTYTESEKTTTEFVEKQKIGAMFNNTHLNLKSLPADEIPYLVEVSGDVYVQEKECLNDTVKLSLDTVGTLHNSYSRFTEGALTLDENKQIKVEVIDNGANIRLTNGTDVETFPYDATIACPANAG